MVKFLEWKFIIFFIVTYLVVHVNIGQAIVFPDAKRNLQYGDSVWTFSKFLKLLLL